MGEFSERLFIELVAPALPDDRDVRNHAKSGQRPDDGFVCSRNIARRINIFDANQPSAVVCSSIQE